MHLGFGQYAAGTAQLRVEYNKYCTHRNPIVDNPGTESTGSGGADSGDYREGEPLNAGGWPRAPWPDFEFGLIWVSKRIVNDVTLMFRVVFVNFLSKTATP